MERITAAISAGRLSFAFPEGVTLQQWAVRSGRT